MRPSSQKCGAEEILSKIAIISRDLRYKLRHSVKM